MKTETTKIEPEDFLQYAIENLEEYRKDPCTKRLLNFYGCIDKGFCSQVEKLFAHLTTTLKHQRVVRIENRKDKTPSFKEQFEYVSNSSLGIPKELLDFYKIIRIDLEHRYKIPLEKEADAHLRSISDFISVSNGLLEYPLDEIKKEIEETLKKVEETKPVYLSHIKKFLHNYPIRPSSLTQENAHDYISVLKEIFEKEHKKNKFLVQQISSVDSAMVYFYKDVLKKDYSKYGNLPKRIIEFHPLKIGENKMESILSRVNSPRKRLFVQLVWYYNYSRSGLYNLRIKDLNNIELIPPMKRNLEEYSEKLTKKKNIGGFLFPGQGGKKMSERAISKTFEKITKETGEEINVRILIRNSPYRKLLAIGDDYLTKNEFDSLIANVEERFKKDCIYFIYNLGIASGQLIEIKYRHIKVDKKIINLKDSRLQSLTVPLSKAMIKTIKENYNPNKANRNEILFPYTSAAINSWIKKALKKSKIKKNVSYITISNSLKARKLRSSVKYKALIPSITHNPISSV